MVIGAFPAAKLIGLAAKQISKPIASVLKTKAKDHPLFRNYICMPPAQMYNWVEVKTKMWALNLGKPVAVPPLTEAMAVELGANLLGEFIIFSVAAGVLILEYVRQVKSEARKQEKSLLEKAELANNLAELNFRLERQDAQLREITRALADLGPPKKAEVASSRHSVIVLPAATKEMQQPETDVESAPARHHSLPSQNVVMKAT